MKYLMDVHDILKLLPHRYPFFLLDRVLAMEVNHSLTALKNVTMNEAFFTGHFPDKPVMPGVLILEAMAQAGAVLAYKSMNATPDDGTIYYLAGIDNARFRRMVEPGDQLRLEVQVLKAKRELWKLSGKAYVDDELACEAEFMSVCKK